MRPAHPLHWTQSPDRWLQGSLRTRPSVEPSDSALGPPSLRARYLWHPSFALWPRNSCVRSRPTRSRTEAEPTLLHSGFSPSEPRPPWIRFLFGTLDRDVVGVQ